MFLRLLPETLRRREFSEVPNLFNFSGYFKGTYTLRLEARSGTPVPGPPGTPRAPRAFSP